MKGSVLRCGVGEERSGGRCKGEFGGCGKVWKAMRGDVGRGVGGSKVWREVREMGGEMWAVGR